MKESRLRNPVPAEGMSTDERLAELVEILAAGLLRGRLRRILKTKKSDRKPVDVVPPSRTHVPVSSDGGQS